MKCPKCGYLGFETGDRCKNCGYDFSLLSATPAPAPDPDVTIRKDEEPVAAPELWLDRLDRSMDEASKNPEHLIGVPEARPVDPAAAPGAALPLFNPDDPDDIPLIALPAAPRPPLAVRRATETSRLRAVPKMARSATPAPALDFRAETDLVPDEEDEAPPVAAPVSRRPARVSSTTTTHKVDGIGGRRLAAALIDHAMLFAIDALVIYFTLRMAGLATSEAMLLPIAPIVTFLVTLKLSYFTAFTAVGGQTIGKMAMGIRVVAERGGIDGARAIKRTMAGLLTMFTFGIGFLPVFFGSDRRTLHDRLTGTRVVGLPSA